MKDGMNQSKSLIDQILEDMLQKLENYAEFDSQTLQELEELVNNGNFNKIKLIYEILELKGVRNETTGA